MNNTTTKLSAVALSMLMCCQSMAQSFVNGRVYEPHQYIAVQDKTRVVKPLTVRMPSPLVNLDIQAGANKIIALHSAGLNTAQKQRDFDNVSNAYIGKFYDVLTGKTKVNLSIYNKVYSAALPLLIFNAALKDRSYYSKVIGVYSARYNACIANLNRCDTDRAGYALMVLYSHNPAAVNAQKLASALENPNINEDAKINFMQYAAPVLSAKGGKGYFKDIIAKLSKQSAGNQVTEGYFDPFAPITAFDNSYRWIKESCTHKDGFIGGVCSAFKGGKKPFRQYKTYPVPATVKNLLSNKYANSKTIRIYNLFSYKVKQPSQLSASLRMYEEFYSSPADWYDSFRFLLNADLPSQGAVASHRDIALANLALKAPAGVKDAAALRAYLAARINNDYFGLDRDKDIDPSLKAELKNELGKTYAALTGYRGASPIKVISDEGFYSYIAFRGNEKEIEGFWGSLFNFKERPAEAVSNVFILGLITKGAVKNSGKIWTAVAGLFRNGAKIAASMPSLVRRARVQYKVLQYLAEKNSMSTARYAYRNALYRSAARASARGGVKTIEGVASSEFFASSHYGAAAHGNISRISKDVKAAAAAGVSDLGKGGKVKSYIPAKQYGSFGSYSADMAKQQRLNRQVVSKFKSKMLSTEVRQAPAVQSAANAPYELPRSYMYSQNKAQALQLAQNEGFAADYSFRNTVYRGLKARGFNFVNTKTGASLGENLTFHHEGYLQAAGKVGLTFSGIKNPAQAAEKLLSGNLGGGLLESFKTGVAAKAVNFFNLNSAALKLNAAFVKPVDAFAAYARVSLLSAGAKDITPALGSALPADAKSIFKIHTPDYSIGSGFLLDYKGMPLVITSGHVVGSNKFVTVENAFGQKEQGTVLSSVFMPGKDLAAISVKPSFFEGQKPFKLSVSQPVNGETVYGFSYPGGGDYSQSMLKVLQNDYYLPGAYQPLYKTTSEGLTFGSSGGAITKDGKVTGVIYAITDKENALSMGLGYIKSFMGSLSRKMISDPLFREQYLPLYPDFAKKYTNLLNKSGYIKSSVPMTQIQKFLSSKDIDLLAAFDRDAAIAQVEQATFRVTRRSDGFGGTGFYVKYRGIPMILTASHVVRNDKEVELIDSEGIFNFGQVWAKTDIIRGHDFAIIFPEKGFLDDKTPLTFSMKEPSPGDKLICSSFGGQRWLHTDELEFVERNFFDGSIHFLFKTVPGVPHGTSGAALVQLGPINKIVGMADLANTDGTSAFFSTSEDIRYFLNFIKKFKLRDPAFDRAAFLKEYPEFAKNYENVLNANVIKAEKIGEYTKPFKVVYTSILPHMPSATRILTYDDDTDLVGDLPDFIEKMKPENFKNSSSVFVINNPNGITYGSGFYIKYRGVPMIVTAAHVTGAENGIVSIADKEGVSSAARVLSSTGTNVGYDVTLLEPLDPAFMKGRTPFNLANQNAQKGQLTVSYGYNKFGDMVYKPAIITAPDAKLPNALGPLYKAVPVVNPGMSGGPVVNTGDNKISGFVHMVDEGNSFFMPVSTLKGVIKDLFKKELANPSQSNLVKQYPEFANNYKNVISSAALKEKKPAFTIGENAKKFGYGIMTGMFKMSPRAALNKLYSWGAKPSSVGYPVLGEKTYLIEDINAYSPDIALGLPKYPFNAGKINYYRGMSLDMPSINNIRTNGLRIQDVTSHNNDYLVLRYQTKALADLAKEADCSKVICFTGNPADAAMYSVKRLDSAKQIPVVVHVKNVKLGTDSSLSSAILLQSSEDVPADKISLMNAMLKVNGENVWGKITFDENGKMLFTPYLKAAGDKLPPLYKPFTKQDVNLKDFGNDFNPAFSPKSGMERFVSGTLDPSLGYFGKVKGGVIKIYNPVTGGEGTGFYLKNGDVEALVTAGHVTEGADVVRVKPAAQGTAWYNAKVAAYSLNETNDIALLELKNANFWNKMTPLPLAQGYPMAGNKIFAYGFPWGKSFAEKAGIFKGFASSENGGFLIAASEHTVPGNSGSPVLYDGKVIGMCKKGLCAEEIAQDPALKGHTPVSYHTTVNSLKGFLNWAVLKAMPGNVQEFVLDNGAQQLNAGKKLLLDPRGYGFSKTLVMGSNEPPLNMLPGTDYSFKNGIKKFGAGIMYKMFGMPARSALGKMYSLGFGPYFSNMPKASLEGYVIKDLSDFKPNWDKPVPPFPYPSNKRYVFRGMSLDTKSIINIYLRGLRLEDVGPDNSSYIRGISPGYVSAGLAGMRTICLSGDPQTAKFYSMRFIPATKPVPTVVTVKGINDKDFMGYGILLNRDVSPSQITSFSVLLNIDGNNVWGKILFNPDGTVTFYPYIVR